MLVTRSARRFWLQITSLYAIKSLYGIKAEGFKQLTLSSLDLDRLWPNLPPGSKSSLMPHTTYETYRIRDNTIEFF